MLGGSLQGSFYEGTDGQFKRQLILLPTNASTAALTPLPKRLASLGAEVIEAHARVTRATAMPDRLRALVERAPRLAPKTRALALRVPRASRSDRARGRRDREKFVGRSRASSARALEP